MEQCSHISLGNRSPPRLEVETESVPRRSSSLARPSPSWRKSFVSSGFFACFWFASLTTLFLLPRFSGRTKIAGYNHCSGDLHFPRGSRPTGWVSPKSNLHSKRSLGANVLVSLQIPSLREGLQDFVRRSWARIALRRSLINNPHSRFPTVGITICFSSSTPRAVSVVYAPPPSLFLILFPIEFMHDYLFYLRVLEFHTKNVIAFTNTV